MATLTIVGNWKMNLSPHESEILIYNMISTIPNVFLCDIVICPAFIALDRVVKAADGSRIRVGAQNLHPEPSGAFTGEVSPQMLAELVEFVILGHSERRALFGESDDFIARKVVATVEAGLKPILCVGESLEQRREGRAEDVVKSQLLSCVSGISDAAGLLVAYEPVWAIGTGEAASPEIAQHMMAAIKSALRSKFGPSADSVPCLYGGSVSPDNVLDFVRQPDVDGALVGGASLDADSFAAIISKAAEADV